MRSIAVFCTATRGALRERMRRHADSHAGGRVRGCHPPQRDQRRPLHRRQWNGCPMAGDEPPHRTEGRRSNVPVRAYAERNLPVAGRMEAAQAPRSGAGAHRGVRVLRHAGRESASGVCPATLSPALALSVC